MKNYYKYILTAVGTTVVIFLFLKATDTDRIKRQQEFNSHYNIYAIDLPEKMDFAGEPVPLTIPDVRERMDRELLVNTYWQSQTLLMLKKKERWFPVIEPILKKNNIPDDFKYLAMAESGFTNVVSPSGASGFWQFLEGTGRHYNLEISSEVDDRYNIEKATQAACDYFKEAYEHFGSWSLVAASYNMGIDGVSKQLDRQKADDYFDLLLVEETSRYVFRILALKEICNNPLKYGFHLRKRDFYEPYKFKTLNIDSSITDIAVFAKAQGVNYKEVKLLNPWLRLGTLTNKTGKKYQIKIPLKNAVPLKPDPADTLWLKTLPKSEYHLE